MPDDFTYSDFLHAAWEYQIKSSICGMDDCDNSLLDYRDDAFFCSPACQAKAWRKENAEYTKEYDKARNKDPVRRAKLYEYQARYLAKRKLENG